MNWWVLMAKLKAFWNGNNNNIVEVDVVWMNYLYLYTSETYSNGWSKVHVCVFEEGIRFVYERKQKNNRFRDSETKQSTTRNVGWWWWRLPDARDLSGHIVCIFAFEPVWMVYISDRPELVLINILCDILRLYTFRYLRNNKEFFFNF